MAFAEKRGKGKDGRTRYRGRYKLPNGRYGSVTRDDDGQPFTTVRSAREYAAGLETDVRRRQFINPRDGRISVRAWSVLWLDSIEVGPLTEKEYRLRLDNHVLPEWGDTAVGDLTAIGCAIWAKQLRAKVSKNYADGIMSTFRTMLDDAVMSKVRGDNPVASRRSGRRGKYRPKPKDERVIASPRQVLLVARNALEMRGLNEYVLVLTSAYTGLRIGEAAAIHRNQLALDDNGSGARIHVENQGQYVDGKFVEIPAKYDSGRGLIIPRFLAELLAELVKSRPDGEWVFTAPKGGRLLRGGDWYSETWHPIVDGRAYRPVVRGAKARPGVRPVLGIGGMTPHGLRHSHKVWLDEDGHPRVAVEERMGHTLQGVEGTYSHTTLAMELRIAETLQARWVASLRPEVGRREYGPIPLVEASSAS